MPPFLAVIRLSSYKYAVISSKIKNVNVYTTFVAFNKAGIKLNYHRRNRLSCRAIKLLRNFKRKRLFFAMQHQPKHMTDVHDYLGEVFSRGTKVWRGRANYFRLTLKFFKM